MREQSGGNVLMTEMDTLRDVMLLVESLVFGEWGPTEPEVKSMCLSMSLSNAKRSDSSTKCQSVLHEYYNFIEKPSWSRVLAPWHEAR